MFSWDAKSANFGFLMGIYMTPSDHVEVRSSLVMFLTCFTFVWSPKPEVLSLFILSIGTNMIVKRSFSMVLEHGCLGDRILSCFSPFDC